MIQAAVRIETDDEGRERLVRYCVRLCFALDRLTVLRAGRVAYRVKYARRGVTHRVKTPIELLARLVRIGARVMRAGDHDGRGGLRRSAGAVTERAGDAVVRLNADGT